jgi:hypothetical protein
VSLGFFGRWLAFRENTFAAPVVKIRGARLSDTRRFRLHVLCREDSFMRTISMPLPMLGFTIATRAALGAGIGVVLADRIPVAKRRKVGSALIALGAVTTIPIVNWLMRHDQPRLTSEMPH